MKFTLSWLHDHLDTTATVEEIADALTDLGLEVEGIENPLAALGAFTIGKVLKAEQHPDADRLRVCQVMTDEGEKQIICGAPNARAGITVVVAKPGMYIPGIDTTIQIGKIRGIESHGMMCSEREMQLSDEHDGIIELPSGEVGDKFTDWLKANDPARVDPVIEIAITPNRPDALGVRGIARDLAARGIGTLKPARDVVVKGEFACPISVTIDADTREKGCEVFMGRLIRGVKNGPSPAWLQKRLRAIGLRPISALVDVTNFFTFDMNRPLHVFDADKVKGDLRVHRALAGEKMVALDDKEYTFEDGMVVISDENGIESIGGIMGGLHTGCTGDTTNVFLEAAVWETIQIAATGRRLKINSDARYRNERGIDPEYNAPAIEEATAMIMELCGGTPSDVVVAGEVPNTSRFYRLDPARVISLVGMDIPKQEQMRILTALGFGVAAEHSGVEVWVPSWRGDVQGEADLVEEVARVASLTKLQGKPLPRLNAGVPRPVLTPLQKREAIARRTTAALGYNECVTYSFVDAKSAALFAGGTEDTRLENPISADMSHMRPDILPGLLQAASRNQARGFHGLALFEVGPTFQGGEPDQNRAQVVGLLVGNAGARDPHRSQRPVDIYDAKADVEAVLSAIGAPARTQIMRNAPSFWHPGRSGQICLGPKNVLAEYGELHPKVLREMDVKGPAVAFRVFPDAVPLPRNATSTRPALAINDLQAVERDFAFVVDEGVEALTLINAALGADKALIETVSVFDEFRGDRATAQFGPGKKSLAVSVRIQPTEKTLTDKDIEAVAAKVIDKVSKATGGTLRS